jgi:hypothetical protein
MGGSSPHSTFSSLSPDELRRRIREAELAAAERQFSPTLAERLNDLLSKVNSRDDIKISARLDDVKAILRDELETQFELKFGGSVAKHTFVDGLSDVDMLLVMKEERQLPRTILDQLASRLAIELKGRAKVSTGRIAVTLTYSDEDEIQLVPAVREGQTLHVPRWREDSWSPIDPDKFRKGLTKRNEECGMKLVPVIKLAKSINGTLPEGQQLSGYHIESMAIAAFKDYSGPKTVEKMLPEFFKRMTELVKAPMRDSTGQSVHVDADLGKANSAERKLLSASLDRIARRMENATAAQSLSQWNGILGDQ